MKRIIFAALAFAAFVSLTSGEARAQSGGVAAGPDPSPVRDMDDLKNAKHELEVARHYFKNKKAYLASFKRADELVTGYPEFPQLDEALYIAGMSGIFLLEGKGKQQLPKPAADDPNALTPDNVRESARMYLERIVTDYPKSDFRKQAEAALAGLGPSTPAGDGAKPQPEKQQ